MKPSEYPEPSEEDMVAHLYGDVDDAEAVEAIEAALAESEELLRAYDELCRTLDLVDEEPIPERGDDYGTEVWRRIEARLGEDRLEDSPPNVVSLSKARRTKRSRTFGATAWVGLAAAAAVLLAAGFLLGRMAPMAPDMAPENKALDNRPPDDRPPDDGAPDESPRLATSDDTDELPALSSAARERLLAAALTEHLGRSERLLTEIANASDAGTRSLSDSELERVWAEELLVSNRLYRRAAEAAGQKRIARLLAELEPVLLELAHVDPDGAEADERVELRRRVDEQGLLFKVRVTESRLSPTNSL